MLHSNKRKLQLSGWLMKNGQEEYSSALKFQKFLFFYEAFTQIDGETPDWSSLKGYRNGPVFGTVLGDYTHERSSFDAMARQEYEASPEQISESRAIKSKFITQIMSERELSDLTHKLNIWKAKKDRIAAGERQVELCESDLDESDERVLRTLEHMYSLEFINNSHIIKMDTHYFLFNKDNVPKITVEHYDTLSVLADSGELSNPIYVEIDDEGRLLVDDSMKSVEK